MTRPLPPLRATALAALFCGLSTAAVAGCGQTFSILGLPMGAAPAGPFSLADFDGGPRLAQASDITKAKASMDQNGKPAVSIKLTHKAAGRFGTHTLKHTGKPIAVVYQGKLMSAPVVQSPIYGGHLVLTGFDTTQAAKRAAQTLNSPPCAKTVQP